MKLGLIKPEPSQTISFFTMAHPQLPQHILLDSGANVSFAKQAYVKTMGWEVSPNGQLALLADDTTRIKSIGEIHQKFRRNECVVISISVISILNHYMADRQYVHFRGREWPNFDPTL